MREYYNKPEETEAAFVGLSNGEIYFKTGDFAEHDEDTGYYAIKGRMSSDILKHKGYKVSALDVENALLSLSCIKECAVIGTDHEVFGQAIVAVVVKSSEAEAAELEESSDLQRLCKSILADYQIPQTLVLVDEIPRNAMGKVNKKQLAEWVTTKNQ